VKVTKGVTHILPLFMVLLQPQEGDDWIEVHVDARTIEEVPGCYLNAYAGKLPPLSECFDFDIIPIRRDEKTVWIAMEYKDGGRIEFIGAFSSEVNAKQACYNRNCFIGPLRVDEISPRDPTIWAGSYYPLAETEYEPSVEIIPSRNCPEYGILLTGMKDENDVFVQCTVCGKYYPDGIRLKAWIENGEPCAPGDWIWIKPKAAYNPDDWRCPNCRSEVGITARLGEQTFEDKLNAHKKS
jgi:hypothetical protein